MNIGMSRDGGLLLGSPSDGVDAKSLLFRGDKAAADDSGGAGENQAGEGVWHGILRFGALGGIVARVLAAIPYPGTSPTPTLRGGVHVG